ncbi:MAG: hypothetical protein VXZ33_08200, partial [Pseudomonadota bacterium]|nr:hypothetical protein [Pseudomonadota bacterium]
GYYWTSDSGIDRWNEQLFVSQTSTMTELTGVLMTADLSQIQSRGTEDSFLDKTNRDQQFGGN